MALGHADSDSNGGKDKRRGEIRFCPVCGSTEIDCVGRLFILSPHMECRECGYRGVFIEGAPEFALKIREEYLKEKDEKSSG